MQTYIYLPTQSFATKMTANNIKLIVLVTHTPSYPSVAYFISHLTWHQFMHWKKTTFHSANVFKREKCRRLFAAWLVKTQGLSCLLTRSACILYAMSKDLPLCSYYQWPRCKMFCIVCTRHGQNLRKDSFQVLLKIIHNL